MAPANHLGLDCCEVVKAPCYMLAPADTSAESAIPPSGAVSEERPARLYSGLASFVKNETPAARISLKFMSPLCPPIPSDTVTSIS